MTTISEGNKSDRSDDKGSSSFNAAMAIVQDKYPDLHNGIVMAHTMKTVNLRKVILIDGQTTHDVFCNNKYVENIRKAKSSLHLSTNGGGMTITQEADVVGLYLVGSDSTVYYNTDAITNILSFKKLAKIYWIIYDSDKSKTFTIIARVMGLLICILPCTHAVYTYSSKKM